MKHRLTILALTLPLLATAQEPIVMEAATQPAVGLNYIRTQILFRDLDGTDEYRIKTRYTRGIRYNVSINAETDYVSGNESGLNDVRLFAKWRVLQKDLGPVDTLRGSLIGGIELPSGSSCSSHSADPFFGGVITSILGRNGFNADLIYQLNTAGGMEGDDKLIYDASWLYRIAPERWSANTTASWYTVLELNGTAWENGDHHLQLTPGLLYEATTWAAEIGVHLPVTQTMSDRPSENFGVTAGVRYLF
jgi:hypothetical protein